MCVIIGQQEGHNLRQLTASLIALLTLGTGIAYAQTPNNTPPQDLAPLTGVPRGLREPSSPTPQPLPKGVPADETKRCPQWEPLIAEYGLPVEAFSYIAWRESRCLERAWNRTLNRDGSQDRGLVQINSTWKTVTANACGTPYGKMNVLFNPRCNLAVAKYLYENGGLRHWSL